MKVSLAIVATLVAWSAFTPSPAAQTAHEPHVPAITASEYQARRAALAKAIGPDGVFIAFSFEPARRTGDVDWPFRQEDNLLYLTGMNVPETTLVMLPGERDRQEFLFASDRDPLNERWTGKIASRDEVTGLTGVRDVVSARRFAAFTDALFQGGSFSPGGGLRQCVRATSDAGLPGRGPRRASGSLAAAR